ncbi:DUF3987 domain-containing protein [Chitinilyticum litopenaei]|uniref:DUF3987 domain-containing protein n=1 Tax=Chitinilyticum litopenaei TaxID=1121276 RepID=UPI000414971D|nr:DUF3987 domain-containing protein [Chitinilyticum litopenaei]
MADITIRADGATKDAARGFAARYLAQGYVAEGLHVYTSQDGAPLFWRFRCKHRDGRKEIRPFWRDGQGFKLGEPTHPDGRPLFNLALLAGADRVILLEGEKAADACTRRGFVALSTGGAGNAATCDLKPLAGRSVHLWADYDKAGTSWACELLPRLLQQGCTAWTVDPGSTGAPDKGDAFDWFELHPDGDPFADLEWEKVSPEIEGPEPFEQDSEPTPWPDDCLPDGMREAAQAIADHAQAPVALAGMAVLAAVAHVAMRLADASHPKTGAMPCSVFVLTLAASGERKSECYRLATRPITTAEVEARNAHKLAMQQAEQEAFAAKPKDRAALLTDLPPDPRTIFTDTTVQAVEVAFIRGSAPALSLSTDEGGSLLGGHSLKSDTRAASLGSLTRLFDGKGCERDRVGEGMGGFRFRVRFGLFLSVQPVVVREALGDPILRGQGFLPRFLLAAPASLAGNRLLTAADLSRRADQDGRIGRYWETLAGMVAKPLNLDANGGLALEAVTLDSAATTEWLDFYNRTESELGKSGDLDCIAAFANRAGELAARIAAVFAIWEQHYKGLALPVVNGDVMRCAVSLVEYSLQEWLAHQKAGTLTQAERDAQSLLHWLQRKDWQSFTRKKLGQYAPGVLRRDVNRRTAAIDELLRRRWLTEDTGEITLFQPAAVAVSAVSAVWTGENCAADSKNSKDSDSKPESVIFQEATTPPNLTADHAAWLDDLEAASMEF